MTSLRVRSAARSCRLLKAGGGSCPATLQRRRQPLAPPPTRAPRRPKPDGFCFLQQAGMGGAGRSSSAGPRMRCCSCSCCSSARQHSLGTSCGGGQLLGLAACSGGLAQRPECGAIVLLLCRHERGQRCWQGLQRSLNLAAARAHQTGPCCRPRESRCHAWNLGSECGAAADAVLLVCECLRSSCRELRARPADEPAQLAAALDAWP